MITLITVIHVSAILILIIAVLLQSGKGAEISASFGGSSQTVFGSSGGANFFTRLTGTLAAIFMTTSLALTVLGTGASRKSVFEGAAIPESKTPAAPVAPAAPGQGAAAKGEAPAKAEKAPDESQAEESMAPAREAAPAAPSKK